MKRKIILVLLLIFISLIFASCQSQINTSLQTVLDSINSELQFSDMKVLESTDELNMYYLIEKEDVDDFAAEISTNDSDMTEIVFVKASDKSAATDIAACLNNYYQTRVDMANSYDSQYAKLLSKCSVQQKGLYVSLIIAEDVDGVTDVYNSYFE